MVKIGRFESGFCFMVFMGTKRYPSAFTFAVVPIPSPVIDFSRSRNVFVDLPEDDSNDIPVSYETVIGIDAIKPPLALAKPEINSPLHEEYILRNKGEENQKLAERASQRALEVLMGKKSYIIDDRYWMLGTGTSPIKIGYRSGFSGKRKEVYSKKPDANRIVGWFFNNIISGFPPVRYVFNESIFLEQAVEGNSLSQIVEPLYLTQKSYCEGLVRAAAHADFLGLDADIKNPRNRIVNSEDKTQLFDFNLIFGPRSPGSENFLLSQYLPKFPSSEGMLEAYKDEQKQIVKRVKKQEKSFWKMAGIAGELEDGSYQSLDRRINSWHESSNLKEYFERKLRAYERS